MDGHNDCLEYILYQCLSVLRHVKHWHNCYRKKEKITKHSVGQFCHFHVAFEADFGIYLCIDCILVAEYLADSRDVRIRICHRVLAAMESDVFIVNPCFLTDAMDVLRHFEDKISGIPSECSGRSGSAKSFNGIASFCLVFCWQIYTPPFAHRLGITPTEMVHVSDSRGPVLQAKPKARYTIHSCPVAVFTARKHFIPLRQRVPYGCRKCGFFQT